MPNTTVIEYRNIDDKTFAKEKLPINEEKKKNMFKGTIAISIVYGVFALVLLFATAFNDTMRDILFNKFLAFTLIFIIGTILIIMLMLYFIFSYVPVNVPVIDSDDYISCPDYWKAEIVDDSIIDKAFDPNYPKNLFKYKCIMNDNIYDKKQLFINTSNVDGTGLRYTNMFSNITVNSTGLTNGIYNSAKNVEFTKEYSNYSNSNIANLYKNINVYNPVKDSTNNIKKFINTNSDSIASNIYNGLEEIAYIQNNYRFVDDKKTSSSNIFNSSNIYSPSPSVLSPIVWQYNDAAVPSIETTAATTSSYNSLILNWQKLTPIRAFNLGNSNGTDLTTVAESITTNLYVYYNPIPSNTSNNVYLGTIQVEYDPKKEPKYTMKYITDGKIHFTTGTNLPAAIASNNILKRNATNNIINITSSRTPDTSLASGLSPDIIHQLKIDEYPIIQIYKKDHQRPDYINRIDARTLNCNIPLICDEIYPSLMAAYDNTNGNNNIRCAYSKICGIPWSDLRCDQQQT